MTEYINTLENGQCFVIGIVAGIVIGMSLSLAVIHIAKMFIENENAVTNND